MIMGARASKPLYSLFFGKKDSILYIGVPSRMIVFGHDLTISYCDISILSWFLYALKMKTKINFVETYIPFGVSLPRIFLQPSH